MGKSKILKVGVSSAVLNTYVMLVILVLVLQSCSKSDSELVTYTGRVLVYDGPEIGEYDEINTSYLKPFADVEVFIDSCEPWSGWLGGGCSPEGKIEETDVTETDGKYSISFRAYNHLSYYPLIDYRSDYMEKSEGYSDDPHKDFILVPRSLIK